MKVSRGLCVVVVLCGALLALASPALAAGLDRSFGKGGALALGTSQPPASEFATDVAVGPWGEIYALQTAYACAPACVLSQGLVRYGFNGGRDRGFAGDGMLELPAGSSAIALAVDVRGRPILAVGGPRTVTLMRVLGDGGLDRSFGEAGAVRISCECHREETRLIALASGKLLVTTPSGRFPEPTLTVWRLRSNGRLDAGFNSRGVATVGVGVDPAPTQFAPLRSGALVAAGEGLRQKGRGPYVLRIAANGKLDRRFLDRSRRAIRSLLNVGDWRGLSGIVPRPNGRFDLYGNVDGEGIVIRLRADGLLDRGFGRGGRQALPWAADAVVAGHSGRVFAVGTGSNGFSGVWLRADGVPLRFYSGGRLREAHGEGVTLELQRGKRPLVFDPSFFECRGFCPPDPHLFAFPSAPR